MKRSVSVMDLVRSFQHIHVLIVGDVMLDTYLEGKAMRLCSEGPVPVVAKTAEYHLPGGAANTAANLRALGAHVSLLGAVGQDPVGKSLCTVLDEYQISDNYLIKSVEIATQHKLRILADGHYVVRFDEGGTREQCCRLVPADQDRLLENFVKLSRSCDLIVISDYGYGIISDALIEQLCILQEQEPKIVLIDSKALYRFRDVRATVVTPNHQEACDLFAQMQGVNPLDRKQIDSPIKQVGQGLLAYLRSEYVAITQGAQGVYLFGRSGLIKHLAAHPVSHANDVGAGDSFTAAMALALSAGCGIEEAAQIGLDAAHIAVTRQYTAIVRQQELLQRVSTRAYIGHQYDNTIIRQDKWPVERDRCLQRRISITPEERFELAVRLQEMMAQGKIVVFANGVFDILHAGHVQFLQQAKSLGDVLVVGVNSDYSVYCLRGKIQPLMCPQDHRLALVAALDMVDYAVSFDEDTPGELIRLLRPAIHVKGGDYVDENLPESVAVHEVGGRVVILPLAGSISDGSGYIPMLDQIDIGLYHSDTSYVNLHSIHSADNDYTSDDL